MPRANLDRWQEDVDLERMRASPRSIAAGWIVVGLVAALMSAGPAAVCAFEAAMTDARHELAVVRHHLVAIDPCTGPHARKTGGCVERTTGTI
jgi:hypothetical protein